MKKIEIVDFRYVYRQAMDNPLDAINTLFVSPLSETQLICGDNESTYNKDLCKENNIPIYNIEYIHNGAILGFPGDICILCLGEDCKDQVDNFIIQFIDYLQEKGINASKSNNDITVTQDGKEYKILGSIVGKTHLAKVSIGGIFININSDTELIKKVCTKFMEKIPLPLKTFNITTEDMVEFIKETWK